MGRMFGTDGVRGVANVAPMTAETALAIGRAITHIGKRTAGRPAIVIGKDTRVSGDMLELALAAGICSAGGNALLTGVLPTPGIAYITRRLQAVAGLVVSASHNPFEDNGIKVFSGSGYKLPDAEEDELEALINGEKSIGELPAGELVGRTYTLTDADSGYVAFCKKTFPADMDLAGLKIVLDCANGATVWTAPAVFRELGAAVEVMHDKPDGVNINAGCGSQHTESLAARVTAMDNAIGLAFDGDGDRLIAIDERGRRLTGDHIMAITARLYRDLGLLRNNCVIATVMSNFGFFTAMRQLNIETGVSGVGDRYVLETMRERNAVIGGEESGHIIFLNHHTSGDGIVAALQLLRAMRHYGQPLAQLAEIMTPAPQKIVNVPVARKPPLDEIAALTTAIQAAEAELAERGRVLVRYSGTQPLCRVMVEGPTPEMTERLALVLAGVIRENIG